MDASGLAVKLFNPKGRPLLIAVNRILTQDFLLTNSPVFSIRDLIAYNALVAAPESLGVRLFPQLCNPWSWRLRERRVAKQVLQNPPEDLLEQDYFSMMPCRPGPQNVKYVVRPCTVRMHARGVLNTATHPVGEDYLHRRLQVSLAKEDGYFLYDGAETGHR